MKTNIGSLDGTIRIIAGLAIIASGYFTGWWGLVGLVPILTGIVRFCPAYLPFGINTCATKPKKQP